MANPFYQQFIQGMTGVSQGGAPVPFQGFQNPIQRVAGILQAITNPAAFVRQRFPDIPVNIQNDPGQVFNYLQQTRGAVSNQQIQQAQQMVDQIQGQGTVR